MKVILILCTLLAVWFIIENRLFLHRRHENFGGDVRIMHVSDIHKSQKGIDNSRISRIAKNEKPDLIFVTGDLISRDEKDFSSAEVLLKNLCRVAPVYMVFGNHEQSLPDDYLSEFLDMLAKTDVKLLSNDGVNLTVHGRNMRIYGVLQEYSTYKKNGSYKNLDKFTLNDMQKILGNKSGSDEVLLLAHNPLWAEVYDGWGADYAFCGHVHGGIVRILGKGMLSPERKLFPKYSKGVYTVGKMKLCVSGGIGKLRLFNPPEIVIYTI